MTDLTFQKATKKRVKARIAIDGPSGSGKTYTALVAATALAEGGKIAVIDTERGSASLYSDEFNFDVLELTSYHPDNYVKAIRAAEAERYPVIVIDSLTHLYTTVNQQRVLSVYPQPPKQPQFLLDPSGHLTDLFGHPPSSPHLAVGQWVDVSNQGLLFTSRLFPQENKVNYLE